MLTILSGYLLSAEVWKLLQEAGDPFWCVLFQAMVSIFIRTLSLHCLEISKQQVWFHTHQRRDEGGRREALFTIPAALPVSLHSALYVSSLPAPSNVEYRLHMSQREHSSLWFWYNCIYSKTILLLFQQILFHSLVDPQRYFVLNLPKLQTYQT